MPEVGGAVNEKTRLGALLAVALLAACAGAPKPGRTMPVPADAKARHRAIDQAGRRIYGALAAAGPERLLVDGSALQRLLLPAAANRALALRVGLRSRLGFRPEAFRVLGTARYLGVCVQGARLEPASSPLGLRDPAFMFERALVAGVEPGGRRIAAWVEGEFVLTSGGFYAIALERVEEPRWEHSDLELAPCDMEVGLRRPQDMVVVTH